jgi:hypothetical protein
MFLQLLKLFHLSRKNFVLEITEMAYMWVQEPKDILRVSNHQEQQNSFWNCSANFLHGHAGFIIIM